MMAIILTVCMVWACRNMQLAGKCTVLLKPLDIERHDDYHSDDGDVDTSVGITFNH